MELDQDGPLTKWKSKNGNRFQLQLLHVKVLLDSSNNAQRGDKTTPNYFYVPKFCNMLCITFIGLLHIYRTQQSCSWSSVVYRDHSDVTETA